LPPPMAHAPKPMGVSCKSELPRVRRRCDAGCVIATKIYDFDDVQTGEIMRMFFGRADEGWSAAGL